MDPSGQKTCCTYRRLQGIGEYSIWMIDDWVDFEATTQRVLLAPILYKAGSIYHKLVVWVRSVSLHRYSDP